MSTDLNRRAILAGAAALPAMSVPALAGDDAELLAIGEKMKALWSPCYEAQANSHEEYERIFELAGLKGETPESACKMGHDERERRWREAEQKTNYHVAYAKWDDLSDKLSPLCERALERKATTLAGVGVQAAAALYLDDEGLDSAIAAWKLLASLAESAGFAIEWSEDQEG